MDQSVLGMDFLVSEHMTSLSTRSTSSTEHKKHEKRLWIVVVLSSFLPHSSTRKNPDLSVSLYLKVEVAAINLCQLGYIVAMLDSQSCPMSPSQPFPPSRLAYNHYIHRKFPSPASHNRLRRHPDAALIVVLKPSSQFQNLVPSWKRPQMMPSADDPKPPTSSSVVIEIVLMD